MTITAEEQARGMQNSANLNAGNAAMNMLRVAGDDPADPESYFRVYAQLVETRTKLQERTRTNTALKRGCIALGVVAAAMCGVAGYSFMKATRATPTLAVIDPGARSVQWLDPQVKQEWSIFQSVEEAFVLNVILCMDSFHRATWYWNWAKCRELADPADWRALEYRFLQAAPDRRDVFDALYPGPGDMADVTFAPFPVRMRDEQNGGRYARVEFTRTDIVGGQRRPLKMVAEITYYAPQAVPDAPSPLGRAINPGQFRFKTYRSDVQP